MVITLAAGGLGCGTGGAGAGPASGSLKGYPARSAQNEAPVEAASAPAAQAVPPPSPNVLAPGGGPIGAPEPGSAPAPMPAPVVRSRADSPMAMDPERASSVEWSQNQAPRPAEGRLRFAVRGVAPDDVLNIRSGPSPRYDVIGTIPPDATGVMSAGARRQVGQSIWREVTYAGVRGWVNDRFLVEEPDTNRAR